MGRWPGLLSLLTAAFAAAETPPGTRLWSWAHTARPGAMGQRSQHALKGNIFLTTMLNLSGTTTTTKHLKLFPSHRHSQEIGQLYFNQHAFTRG